MKRFFTLEPGLRFDLNPKKAKRKSFKWMKQLRNRSFRKHLKNNPEGIRDYKKNYDWEF